MCWWPLVWKAWKFQWIWQLSGKSQEIDQKLGKGRGKILSGETFIVDFMFEATPFFISVLVA